MASGWAVGSAAVLALSVAAVALDPARTAGDASGPARAVALVLLVLVYLAWASALARAAHGARAAMLVLLGHALAWGVLAGALDLVRAARAGIGAASAGPLALGAALVVAGAAASVGLGREVGARRGPLQVASAVGQLVPTLLLAGLLVLLGR